MENEKENGRRRDARREEWKTKPKTWRAMNSVDKQIFISFFLFWQKSLSPCDIISFLFLSLCLSLSRWCFNVVKDGGEISFNEGRIRTEHSISQQKMRFRKRSLEENWGRCMEEEENSPQMCVTVSLCRHQLWHKWVTNWICVDEKWKLGQTLCIYVCVPECLYVYY